ncbi:MAG: hypothetical protein ND866_31295 [Pyrinomonadaceae bacterium]|nr:hypothetical protein [Pyrinomonadaceae bacterium]
MTMNGLRVYIKPNGTDLRNSHEVFYSRRGNGPYYRWLYEENAAQWRVSRVISADFTPQSLAMASWKAVPVALQTRLGEHYLE